MSQNFKTSKPSPKPKRRRNSDRHTHKVIKERSIEVAHFQPKRQPNLTKKGPIIPMLLRRRHTHLSSPRSAGTHVPGLFDHLLASRVVLCRALSLSPSLSPIVPHTYSPHIVFKFAAELGPIRRALLRARAHTARNKIFPETGLNCDRTRSRIPAGRWPSRA